MIKKQSAVGIFVFIGLLCIGYLTIKLGKMEVFGSNSYTVEAQFSSVQGLRNGANVEIAGVQVGRVSAINLDPESYVAKISMKINKDIALSDDTMASIKTSGLIGDKFIELTPAVLMNFWQKVLLLRILNLRWISLLLFQNTFSGVYNV